MSRNIAKSFDIHPSRWPLFLVGVLWISNPSWGSCSNWDSSNLECREYRLILQRDSTQSICFDLIEAYKKGEKSAEKLNKISRCLRQVAHPSKLMDYQNALVPKMPDGDSWYHKTLKNLRIHREFPSALDLAYLCTLYKWDSPLILGELSELYLMTSRFVEAGKVYLQEVRLNSSRYQTMRFKMKSLMRSSALEIEAVDFLDSIISTMENPIRESWDLLLDLSWEHKHYDGVFASLIGKNKSHRLSWGEADLWIRRLEDEGLLSPASELLEAIEWRKFAKRDKKEATVRFLSIGYKMKAWETLCFELNQKHHEKDLSPEANYYLSAAASRCQPQGEGEQKQLRKTSLAMAESLVKNAPSPWNYRSVFVLASLYLSGSNPTKAREILLGEKENPNRLEGSGALLHWLAMVDLLEGKYASADSLLILASSYIGEETTNRSLEIRHQLLLDTNKTNRKNFFVGIPESPKSRGEKLKNLKKVPSHSGLWSSAQLQRASIYKTMGKKDSVTSILGNLAKKGNDPWISHQSRALLNFLDEDQKSAQKALAIYNEILLKYQQGMISEFTRERVQKLKNKLK